jgi:transglutaminase-like putative cysteine protease
MLMRIRHETIYRYSEPAKAAVQKLLVTPRNYNGQHVVNWRIEVDRDCRLRQSEDAFGNVLHCFTADGPFESLTTLVEGEVETFDTAGVVSDAIERFPAELFLRETALTAADTNLRDFARAATEQERTILDRLHALTAALHGAMEFDSAATQVVTSAAQAFMHKKGVCQDFAHIFVACARTLEIPARYVSGYFKRSDGQDAQAAGHAWAEAYVEGLGWVGFDPAHKMSPNEAFVRIAVALDYLGAAPIRGARTAGGEEVMEVRLRVAMARAQSQS